MDALRLNLGCGSKKLDGFVNVDKFGDPDLVQDLETFPWPWPNDSADVIALVHVLEHLGQDPKIYIRIFREIYRICRDGADIAIVVPHPKSDGFLGDPTHVRPIIPASLRLFSQRFNRYCIEHGWPNTPLGLHHGVDFEMESVDYTPGSGWDRLHPGEEANRMRMVEDSLIYNNIIGDIHMVLRVIKPAGRTCESSSRSPRPDPSGQE